MPWAGKFSIWRRELSDMKEDQCHSRVDVVIITDSQDNSSREFRKDQVEKRIKE
jgi:hypothetical protein